MTELWDIARYVEENPEDHKERWRLAKKFYAAKEYRLALEHLQVLRNEWEAKPNVFRYLAAAYYRMGRHEEAAKELEAAIALWPREMGLREQFAHALEAGGRFKEAADAWRAISDLEPRHPIAAAAEKRLLDKLLEAKKPVFKIEESDGGIELPPGQICPACGANNSDEFDRCWQCHGPLDSGRVFPSASSEPRHDRAPLLVPENIRLAGGLAAAVLLSLCLYLSLKLLIVSPAESPLVVTLWEIYLNELRATRMAAGLLLLGCWPVFLYLSLILFKAPRPISLELTAIAGIMPPALAYAGSWLPPHLLLYPLPLALLLSLLLIAVTFGLGPGRVLGVWFLHVFLTLLVASGGLIVFESSRIGAFFNPVDEIPKLIRFHAEQRETGDTGRIDLPGVTLPIRQKLHWESSGSNWLDHRGSMVYFTVYRSENGETPFFEIKDATGTRVYEAVSGSRWNYDYRIDADARYEIAVTGPEGAPCRVVITGLLKPRW
jgi:hypothetical protein